MMFPNQNANKNTEQINLSQEQDLKIKDIPIHTMQKDLEEINNPKASNEAFPEFEEETPTRENTFDSFSEIQKTSPFLSSSPEQEKEENKEKVPGTESANNGFNFGKSFAIVTVILIIFIAAGATYYFFATRQDSPEIVTDISPTENKSLSEPELITPPSKPLPGFSTDKPNYLKIDIETADGAKIKETIFQYASKVAEENITTPVEFLITDSQNNPVSFKTFADKTGIKFSPALLSNLNDSFSLFIYNDNGKSRTGLAIDSQNESQLKSSMLQEEEKNIAQEIEPLFLASGFSIKNDIFRTSNYDSAEIRYLNIISPNDLSVDYAIKEGKLLLGTTKMTLRSMIDYFNAADLVE